MQAKKLIEVAMPIKEISAESVRDKSIRSGHISTLHLWWARRPIPVSRAVVFASLVPDPLDNDCPPIFKEAVISILGKESNIGDPYKPYKDIPFTSAIDEMEDNLRNRLLMFIGKFSDKYCENERIGKPTNPKDLISDFSLIKSENKNNEEILNKARKLIFIAHNHKSGDNYQKLINIYEKNYKNIKDAENALFEVTDWCDKGDELKEFKKNIDNSISSYLEMMPKVFDPFTGGGSIPLEAARLGCKSYGNDINPVAHIIQKASLEFPQRFGKPITYSKDTFKNKYGSDELISWCRENGKHPDADKLYIDINNRLAFDVEYYSKLILKKTEEKIGKFYPSDSIGKKPQAYYWIKVSKCINPTCRAEVPMLKHFYLSQRRSAPQNKWVHFKPIISSNKIDLEIGHGVSNDEGWNNRGNMKCPICGNTTDIKEIKKQSNEGLLKDRLFAVIEESKDGKLYRKPTKEEVEIIEKIDNQEIPQELMQKNSAGGDTLSWGIKKWGEIYSKRQLLFMHSVINEIKQLTKDLNLEFEYKKAIFTYLAILVDRVAMRNNKHSRWHVQQDTIENIFGRQAISMIFDYPEMNPFSSFTSSAPNQIGQIIDYIKSESHNFNYTICNNSESGDHMQFDKKYLSAVVTDPPYYDAIAYADLSDFFYLWLKRSLNEFYPQAFATPQTPKSEECTALKHHHENDYEKAKNHFENKLLNIFSVIENQTNGLVSIMFAHQSTEAWTTLCNSILGANMNITGSWAIDTESTVGLKSNKAYLSSSVTVSCVPSTKSGLGDFKNVKKSIEEKVAIEVDYLYKMGFRGSDLLTACFGQAVSEFGKFESVEKADGSVVTVQELLEIARESAFNALLKGFEGDDFTKFYIGWLQLFGFTANEHNTAMRIVQIGLSIRVNDLYKENILLLNNNESTLANYSERVAINKNIGERSNSSIIDIVHKAMWLYKGTSRNLLLEFISKVADSPESSFWRVLTSLCEILPNGTDDYSQANGLLSNKDSLIKESRLIINNINQQGQLEF